MTLAEDLAEYSYELDYGDLPPETVEMVKNRVIDSLACALAGKEEKPLQRLRSYTKRKSGEPTAGVIGSSERMAIEYAVLTNSSLIRYLDWSDTYQTDEPGVGHPSGVIGATLSAADAYDCTGEQFIVATALGYELHCRLADAVALRRNGFDHVNYGIIASTLAVGTLMELTQDELVEALNIALSGHIALRTREGGEVTEWKGIAYANAARNAVNAAEMAQMGIHGPKPIFEGKFGFFNQVSGEFDIDTSTFGGNGGGFRVHDILQKMYPICAHAIAPADCAIRLLDTHDVDWRDIERIEIQSYADAIEYLADAEKWDPQTRETADHSMPYCVARAFVDGDLGFAQFSDEKIADSTVRTLMERIEIVENPAFNEQYGEGTPATITVETATDVIEHSVTYPRGHPRDPLSHDDLTEKLAMATVGSDANIDVEAIVDYVDSIETKESLSDVFSLLQT